MQQLLGSLDLVSERVSSVWTMGGLCIASDAISATECIVRRSTKDQTWISLLQGSREAADLLWPLQSGPTRTGFGATGQHDCSLLGQSMNPPTPMQRRLAEGFGMGQQGRQQRLRYPWRRVQFWNAASILTPSRDMAGFRMWRARNVTALVLHAPAHRMGPKPSH